MKELSTTEPAVSPVKHHRTGSIPKAQKDLAFVSKNVAESYMTSNSELEWMSKVQFHQLVADFTADIELAERGRINRQPITGTIAALDSEIEFSTTYVKGFITLTFGKKHKEEHYREFGLATQNKNWRFPVDQNDRITALARLLDAMTLHNINHPTYGFAYWQDIATRYENAVSQSVDSVKTEAESVRAKNERREMLTLALNSLILMIKANHPKDYKARLRAWGFIKERY